MWLLYILAGCLILFVIRICIVFANIHFPRNRNIHTRKKSKIKLLIVIGSGGHTHEMLQLIGALKSGYEPRIYVVANTDDISIKKIHSLEEEKGNEPSCFIIEKIPRSREVNQSYLTSVWTTTKAILYSVPLIIRHKPDVVLCNGPGTCIPICLAAFMFNVLCLTETIIINVESICRVQTLSLSGKILYYFAHEFIVQWPQLQKLYPRSKYLGRLV